LKVVVGYVLYLREERVEDVTGRKFCLREGRSNEGVEGRII